MIAIALALLAAAGADSSANGKDDEAADSASSMINEESPDVFLAKATLQQYLSRVVRKDWDAAKRLTHPKALAAIESLKRRTGSERHNLAPWADKQQRLESFSFGQSRQVAAGVIAIAVAEDTFHAEEKGTSNADPAVYLLFKARGAFLVGDKKAGAELSDVSDDSVRLGYPGWVDHAAQAQGRNPAAPPKAHR